MYIETDIDKVKQQLHDDQHAKKQAKFPTKNIYFILLRQQAVEIHAKLYMYGHVNECITKQNK